MRNPLEFGEPTEFDKARAADLARSLRQVAGQSRMPAHVYSLGLLAALGEQIAAAAATDRELQGLIAWAQDTLARQALASRKAEDGSAGP